MLSELVVHNFALIRRLEVSFGAGMTVLTGETGAGKSILVGAVNLILGSRASQEMIRTGASEAGVEAVFSLPEGSVSRERLREWGIDASGEEVVIRRAINRNGRNRIFINGRAATLQQLQQLAGGLISVSGQHEHQLLLDPAVHLELLDTFGRLDAPLEAVRNAYGQWYSARERLQTYRKNKREQAEKIDWMKFRLSELEAADLQPDEDTTLERERHILRHAATLSEAARGADSLLYSQRGAVLERLAEIRKLLETLNHIDSSQGHLLRHLEESRIQLEELSHSLRLYSQDLTFDPQRLAAVEDRLALLHRLGKKYGGSVAAMLELVQELRATLGPEGDSEFREKELSGEVQRFEAAYIECAGRLSLARREAATRLSEEVEKILAGLDMPRVRFSVGFDNGDAGSEPLFSATGLDRVELLLSANPGEALKPLVRIASGGELSRILLALKSLLGRRGDAETLIFDEVDTGIGGRTAELVGRQLKHLAEMHQVVCITHLPQIACCANSHYKVEKHAGGEETATDLRILSRDERVEELARMLGGVSVSDVVRRHAGELLEKEGYGT